MDEEIRKLMDRAARTRYQFLTTEVQTCLTALELANFENSTGHSEIVEREIAAVEKGISVIERFLPELSAEQKPGVEAGLAELKSKLNSLKEEFGAPE